MYKKKKKKKHTCVYQHISSSLSSGPKGVSLAGHQCDRLYPSHPHPSNQSGPRGGAEGTNQRAGTTGSPVLNKNTVFNEHFPPLTLPLHHSDLSSDNLSMCVFVRLTLLLKPWPKQCLSDCSAGSWAESTRPWTRPNAREPPSWESSTLPALRSLRYEYVGHR